MTDILVIDNEKPINDLIKITLQTAGHQIWQAFSGTEALEFIKVHNFDLAFLDIMLPLIDGYQLLPYFVKKRIPVIYLTNKDSLKDSVQALQSEGDDYIVKPFEPEELLERVNTVLRRSSHEQEIFEIKDIRIDFLSRKVWKSGKEIDLTSQEFLLLEVLAKNCNIALSRDQILKLAWGYEYGGETRTVDIHIQRLRRKLGMHDIIQTVYKYGYRLEKQ